MVGQYANGSESHRLMYLVVTINGYKTTCLLDSGATHSFVYTNLLKTAFLWSYVDEPLEVVLANSEKVKSSQVCKVPINFGQGVC